MSKAMEKFEHALSQKLAPMMQKVDNQPYLTAIKKAMVALLPFTIIGSFFCLIPGIGYTLKETGLCVGFANLIINNQSAFDLPFLLSLGFLSVYTVVGIAFTLAKEFNLHATSCIGLSLYAFLLLAVSPVKGGITTQYLGTKGLFCAIIAAMLATWLYRWCIVKKITIRMPEGVPDFVSSSFEVIPVVVIISTVFLAIRGFSLKFCGDLPPQILTTLLRPLINSMDSFIVVLVVVMFRNLLFFFGIHPSVISPIVSPIEATYLAENIEAMKANLPLPHFYTNGVMSAFGGFSGTGITIGLVLCCLMSKSKAYKRIGGVALFPALFGINEPVIFGLPILLNPILFLPFVVGGAIIATFPMFLMKIDWLGRPFFTPPYVGVFLEGFLTNNDPRSLVANAIQLVMSIALYLPFFKIMEKRQIELENSDKIGGKKIFSKEDEELLGDLDF